MKQELNQLKQSTMRAQIQQQQQQQAQQVSGSNRPSPCQQQPGIKMSYSFSSSRPGSNHPSPHSAMSPASSSYSVQQISPAPSADLPPNFYTNGSVQNTSRLRNSSLTHLTPISNNPTPAKSAMSSNSQDDGGDNFDCGVCLKDNCLCESVGLKDIDTNKKSSVIGKDLQNQLNSFKPMAAVSLSRKRTVKSIDEEQEIDFTKQFSTKTKPMPDLKRLKRRRSHLLYQLTIIATTTTTIIIIIIINSRLHLMKIHQLIIVVSVLMIPHVFVVKLPRKLQS